MTNKVYHWITNSVAVPFFSDENSGFIKASTAMSALKKVVKDYKHPCGLYAAVVESCEPKPKLLARYLSAKAVATEKASELTEGGILKENNKIQVLRNGEYEYIFVEDFKEKWEDLEDIYYQKQNKRQKK